jgi:uncharacterized membrane protein
MLAGRAVLAQQPITRRRRKQTNQILELTTDQILQLENSTKKNLILDDLKKYIPLFMWFIWLLIGMCFYAQYSGLGWIYGLYMSVNIGWSIAWVMPPVDVANFEDTGFKLFSMVHTSIGTHSHYTHEL